MTISDLFHVIIAHSSILLSVPAGDRPSDGPQAVADETPATCKDPKCFKATHPEKIEPLEELNSLGLFKWGVSAGAGFAFVLPLHHPKPHSLQTSWGAGGIAYLAWNPWVSLARLGGITREYCAARLGFSSQKSAQRRADRIAAFDSWETYRDRSLEGLITLNDLRKPKEQWRWQDEEAHRLVCEAKAAEILSQIDPGPDVKLDGKCIDYIDCKRYERCREDEKCGRQQKCEACDGQKCTRVPGSFHYNDLAESIDAACGTDKMCFARAREARMVQLAARAETGWLPGHAGTCRRYFMPGFYGGYVFGIKGANFNGLKFDEVPESVATLGSFGLSWTPTPYLSFLVGFTIVKVPVKPDATEKDMSASWTSSVQPVIAIGGTLDIFAKLFE